MTIAQIVFCPSQNRSWLKPPCIEHIACSPVDQKWPHRPKHDIAADSFADWQTFQLLDSQRVLLPILIFNHITVAREARQTSLTVRFFYIANVLHPRRYGVGPIRINDRRSKTVPYLARLELFKSFSK